MESIKYYVQILKLMFSKDNQKNILKSDTCCGCFLFLLFIVFLTITLTSCVFAITGSIGYMYTRIIYSNIYNVDTGCILNSTSICKMQVTPHGELNWCHLGTIDNAFCCIGPGFAILTLTFMSIMMLCILYLWVGCCKADVMESYESSQQMTDILIDKVTTHKKK